MPTLARLLTIVRSKHRPGDGRSKSRVAARFAACATMAMLFGAREVEAQHRVVALAASPSRETRGRHEVRATSTSWTEGRCSLGGREPGVCPPRARLISSSCVLSVRIRRRGAHGDRPHCFDSLVRGVPADRAGGPRGADERRCKGRHTRDSVVMAEHGSIDRTWMPHLSNASWGQRAMICTSLAWYIPGE